MIGPGESAGNDVDSCIHVIDVVGCECLNVLGKADTVDMREKQGILGEKCCGPNI